MHPLSDELIELIAERFAVMGEPTRIKLLNRLRDGEATVLELTAATHTTQQNVSKHLGILQRAGIVARRKQGTFSYYRIVDQDALSLCEAVCGSLQRRVESLGRLVDEGVVTVFPQSVSGDPPLSARSATAMLES